MNGMGWLSLQVVALIHTAGAFAILSFLVVHVYMITTGHTIFAHMRAMITGWEEVSEDTPIEDWEQKVRKEPQPAG
jgi:cytochrome b subunit of formate dehydrogenase